MTDYEKWYQFCMLCKHSYVRKDDADMIYCSSPVCPYGNLVKEMKGKKNDNHSKAKGYQINTTGNR